MELMLELSRALQFSAKVPKLLGEHRDLPPVAFDAFWEEWVRSECRYSHMIVATFPMPAPIQALHTERWDLFDELMLGNHKRNTVSIEARIITLQLHMAKWMGDEIHKRKYIKDYVMGRKCYFGVGAKWRALVIECLPE